MWFLIFYLGRGPASSLDGPSMIFWSFCPQGTNSNAHPGCVCVGGGGYMRWGGPSISYLKTRVWRISSTGTGGMRFCSLLKAFWALLNTGSKYLGFLGRTSKRTLPRHQHSLSGCKTGLPETTWIRSKER